MSIISEISDVLLGVTCLGSLVPWLSRNFHRQNADSLQHPSDQTCNLYCRHKFYNIYFNMYILKIFP